jgi:hypothetical protein
MERKDRSDATIKKVAAKHDIPEEAFRNPDGRKTRNDKKVGTVRKDSSK